VSERKRKKERTREKNTPFNVVARFQFLRPSNSFSLSTWASMPYVGLNFVRESAHHHARKKGLLLPAFP